jgi:exonuclease SbcC
LIITSITLNNIRSYTSPPPIELSTGVTLFEGDVGCGKSTILTAIEFALFGLGELDGSYLLRHGEKTGSVLLEFSVKDRNYKVFRSIERKRTSISQKDGYLVENGVRTDYSVTEMKLRVLEILDFNENPRPKTSSLIYRYAIFTPQEMMKEVLFQPVERRLETLRRAFRIEDYSIINNNASILLTRLENEGKVLRAQTSDIAEKRNNLKQENGKLKNCHMEASKIIEDFDSLKNQRQQVTTELESLQDKKQQVLSLQVEIPSLEREIRQINNSHQENVERKKQLINELSVVTKSEETLAQITPLYEEYTSKNSMLEQLEPTITENQELNSKMNSLLTAIEKEKQHLSKQITDSDQENAQEGARINKEKAKIQKIPELEKEEATLTNDIQSLDELSNLLITLNQENSAAKQNKQNKEERSKELKNELIELRKIGIGAPCPKCKQELTQTHFRKVEQDYLKEIADLENSVSTLLQEVVKRDSEISDISFREKTAKKADKRLSLVKQELAKLKQQEERTTEDEERLAQKWKIVENNKVILQKELFGLKEREQLSGILSRLSKLQPELREHESIKLRLKELEKLKVKEQFVSCTEKISRKDQINFELKQKEEKILGLAGEIASAQIVLTSKKLAYDKEKKVLEIIQGLETKKDAFNEQCEEMNGKHIGKQKDIERCNEEILRIQEEIDTKEAQLQKFDELNQIQLWISEYFMPAVKLIETNVLSSINAEFNILFQKWLNQLLETGDIAVRVDENFTPIVEQNGYEMEVGSLSGGEKTSVALAYRLALNVMVKKVCEAMQSNLLILDEPTDGFSKEQLFRLRDILNELKCEQVITVSHENELEGFVDKIYKITKEAGESKISLS